MDFLIKVLNAVFDVNVYVLVPSSYINQNKHQLLSCDSAWRQKHETLKYRVQIFNQIIHKLTEIDMIDSPKHAKFVYLTLHFLKTPLDSMKYNREHYGMHDDT